MVFRTFTQTYDMNTEQDAPVLLGIHTPIGGDAYKFLKPFFEAYRKYKYLGCDVTIVNAAHLPVDPEQIGKIEGTNYVDPRDTLNPMMFKGCHGEHLGGILNTMYGGLTSNIFNQESLDKVKMNTILEDFYYTALGDDAWRKSPVQKTLRIRGLHPLVYGLATNHQIAPNVSVGVGGYAINTSANNGTAVGSSEPGKAIASLSANDRAFDVSNTTLRELTTSPAGFVQRTISSMFTNKCQRLGWMDTMNIVGDQDAGSVGITSSQIAQLPKLFMGLLMLPPSYLCRQYLRVIITHKYKFSGYRTITTGGTGQFFGNGAKQGVGYIDALTGNISTKESNTQAYEDTVDYDAIEEVDDNEPCE